MAGEGGLSEPAQAILDAVAAEIRQGPVAVALSGGPDSAAAAWALAALGVDTRAISVDHGLPGSEKLMEAAADIAESLGIPHERVVAAEAGTSETELRRARLQALEAAALPGESIVTGHTKDDLAETVLGNVLRGTGTAGLAGIPGSRGRFVRPLLGITRKQTRQACLDLGLAFVDDPQNADPNVRRNRLRTETIPALAEAYNPRLVDALARLGSAAAGDDAVLEERAARVPVRHGLGAVLVPTAALTTLPDAVAARVARRAIRTATPGPHGGTMSEVAAVLGAARGGERATIAGGVEVVREGPWVALVIKTPSPPAEVDLPVGGAVRFGAWSVSADATTPALGRFSVRVGRGPLRVRAPRPGDRISLRSGSKSVGDAMAEAGIPSRLRPQWPLLESGGRILWVAGVRSAPRRLEPGDVTVRMTRRPH